MNSLKHAIYCYVYWSIPLSKSFLVYIYIIFIIIYYYVLFLQFVVFRLYLDFNLFFNLIVSAWLVFLLQQTALFFFLTVLYENHHWRNILGTYSPASTLFILIAIGYSSFLPPQMKLFWVTNILFIVNNNFIYTSLYHAYLRRFFISFLRDLKYSLCTSEKISEFV